jgi:GNAT superfamily N-acetyltransferase
MLISLCDTDASILDCYPVLSQLRPHVQSDQFLPRIRLQQHEGYHLAAARDSAGKVTAVAGFRVATFLAWGRTLYVDDLVTDQSRRSENVGHHLFQWLLDHARTNACDQLHLDSGVQRFDAHRFYLRERMAITAHHFGIAVATSP